MGDGDDFTIWLSRPIEVQSLRVVTGDTQNQDGVTNGFIEVSSDGSQYSKIADFNTAGIAEAQSPKVPVRALRIRLNRGQGLRALLVREISIQSPTPVTHVQLGPGRAFSDISQAPDVAAWAQKAERQMEEAWPAIDAQLYSPGFIPPNKVNVVYRGGPDVTPVAATGGGVMTVNVKWAREQPADTGLTVHEIAHAIQAYNSYNPVWLVEGIADYVRWVRYEPENFRVQIDPLKSTWHDPYRTSAAFLGWCEIHYDSRLATKLNHDLRFGTYNDGLFKKYTGKDADTLWAEFVSAYRAGPREILKAPVPPADQPRTLPVVKADASTPVDLSKFFNAVGFVKDGATFKQDQGFDDGGFALSASLLGNVVNWQNVRFTLGSADASNMVSSQGQKIALPRGKYASLWLMGAAVQGAQKGQTLIVTYSDGSTQELAQNFSDWYAPDDVPGESRAIKMDYRNASNGARDARTFYAYSYGFSLDGAKEVASLTLPNNPNVKILAATVAN
jgi:hypothetical protein